MLLTVTLPRLLPRAGLLFQVIVVSPPGGGGHAIGGGINESDPLIRAVKRRPKTYPLLTIPRALARAHVQKYGQPEKLKGTSKNPI